MNEKQIDIVIPVGYGSLWQDNELRHSLRSIEKHVSGFNNVVIVGEVPSWLKNVTAIPVNEVGKCTTERIFRKLLAACRSEKVSDQFLYCNDDYFFTSNINAGSVPNYYQWTLEEMASRVRKGGGYKEALLATYEALKEKKLPTLYYDIHLPVIIDKKKFRELAAYNWNTMHGFVIKSLYCNSAGIENIEEYSDLKINHTMESETELADLIAHRFMFSIGDNALNDFLKGWLRKEFPNKSKFEL